MATSEQRMIASTVSSYIETVWNSVSTGEAELTELAIKELEVVPWAKPLLARLTADLEIGRQNRSLLFEIRFAYALHQQGHQADYEFYAGVGTSTVDFRVSTPDQEWLIELVSLSESQAVKNATTVSGPFEGISLHSSGNDIPDSEEGEVLKAQERIVEKVFTSGNPTKFPLPSTRIHTVVADMRSYLGIGSFVADKNDYREI